MNLFLSSPNAGKRKTKPVVAILISSVGFIALNLVFGLSMQQLIMKTALVNDNSFLGHCILNTLGMSFTFGPIALLLFLYTKKYELRDIKTLGFAMQKPITKFIKGAILGVVMLSSILLLMIVFNQVEITEGSPELRTGQALLGLLILLFGRLIQAGTEEVVFRGLLLPNLFVKWGLVLSVIVSSLVFGVIHAFTNPSFLAVLNLCLYGSFLALFAIVDKSIWGVCAWHTFWNWAEGGVLGFSENGDSAGKGLLFNVKFIGNNLLTGGSNGTNGSLFLTLVLSIGIVVLMLKVKKDNSNA